MIEPRWCILEEQVRKHFPPALSRSDLDTVLEEEWIKIPLGTVKDLYLSSLRPIDAAFAAKRGPTLYQ